MATGDTRWGIVGVSLRSPDTRDALAPQGGLYTLAIRDADAAGAPRERLQVLHCLTGLLVAPEDPPAVSEAIAHADTRIVSLTVTERATSTPRPAARSMCSHAAWRCAARAAVPASPCCRSTTCRATATC